MSFVMNDGCPEVVTNGSSDGMLDSGMVKDILRVLCGVKDCEECFDDDVSFDSAVGRQEIWKRLVCVGKDRKEMALTAKMLDETVTVRL